MAKPWQSSMLTRAMIVQIFVQPGGHDMFDSMLDAVGCKSRTQPFAEIPAAVKCLEAGAGADACQRLLPECRVLPVLDIGMAVHYGIRGAGKYQDPRHHRT